MKYEIRKKVKNEIYQKIILFKYTNMMFYDIKIC